MKANILAAGKGTRVSPITDTQPKPMLPILNTPVMEMLVRLLADHGIGQIMVNTGHLASSIKDYFRDGSRFGVEIAYSFEGRMEGGRYLDDTVGSAGALRRVQDRSGFFDESFVVMCGDAVVDLDLTELLRFHQAKGAMATIALAEVPLAEVSHYGVVVRDAGGRITGFQEKPAIHEARSTTVNTGIYIFEPEVLNHIPRGVQFDIGRNLFPELVRIGAAIYGAALPFQWLDIGKLNDYFRVTQMALRGEIHHMKMPGRQVAEGVWAGLDAKFDLRKSRIEPPVYIGAGAIIEPGCSIIGPALIGQGCVIESGSHIEQSVIFDETRVGIATRVVNMMLSGAYAVNASGTVIDIAGSDLALAITDTRGEPADRASDMSPGHRSARATLAAHG
jgi:mannose-1-phosphate guanylyltransferase